MPTTINGIGTHYYGKRDRSVRNAPCHSCNRFGPLESYGTRLWFVVVFIPVIPLGRKRIIDSCPSCRRHLVAAADKYEQARQLQTSGSLERFRRERTPETAIEAHGQFLGFHDFEQASTVRVEALDLFRENAELRIAFANQLRQAALYDDMAQMHQQAHALDPDMPQARAGVALLTMNQGSLDEARQLLDFMEEPGAGREYELGPLYTLAGKYAAADRHEEALELYGILLREAPHLAQRPDFRTAVRNSERAHRGGESVLPGRRHSLRGLFVADGSPYSSGQRKFALFALALVLGTLGLVGSNEYIRRHRFIRVVNAGDPVQVQVDDGPSQTIAGLGSVPIAEGKHRVKVSGPVQETHEVTIETGYFDRWSQAPVWILNPGLEAVLQQTTLYYAAQLPQAPSQSLIIGQPFVTLPNVDYAFTEPPDSISLKGKNKVVTKEAIRWVQGEDSSAFNHLLASNRTAAFDFAEKRLRHHPNDAALLETYTNQVLPDDMARAGAFFQSGLSRKPLSIPWHRAAQGFGTVEQRRQMLKDYDVALTNDPNNAALLYLRGRIDPDDDRLAEYYEKSIAADPQLPWPVVGLGFRALTCGRWEEALTRLRQAEALGSKEDALPKAIHTARLALGQAETLVGEYRARLGSNPMDGRTLALLCDALAVAGHPEQINNERVGLENRLPPEVRGSVSPTLRAMATYFTAQPAEIDQFVQTSLPSVGPDVRTYFLLATGKAEQVASDPNLNHPTDPWDAGAVALGLALAGRDEEAKTWQARVAEMLAQRPDEDQRIVEVLRSLTPPAVEQVDRVVLLPSEKVVLLALLAQNFPAQRAEYHQAVARYNVRRTPPYLLIQRATAGEVAANP